MVEPPAAICRGFNREARRPMQTGQALFHWPRRFAVLVDLDHITPAVSSRRLILYCPPQPAPQVCGMRYWRWDHILNALSTRF